MSNEENPGQQGHSGGSDPHYGAWQPTPQSGEYDADATAFVHLPPEDLANVPLAAPGHGYVPPMILPLTPAVGLDPTATGSWVVQTQAQQAQAEARAQNQAPGAVHWPDPNQQGLQNQHGLQNQQGLQHQQGPPAEQRMHEEQRMRDEQYMRAQQDLSGQGNQPDRQGFPDQQSLSDQHGLSDRHGLADQHGLSDPYLSPYQETAHSTAQWNFSEVTGEPPAAAAGPETIEPVGHTGEWTIPVADGDLPDESGEFLASAQAPQWYADSAPPATLPGGAPAPWAAPEAPASVLLPLPAPETTAAASSAEAVATVEPSAESPVSGPVDHGHIDAQAPAGVSADVLTDAPLDVHADADAPLDVHADADADAEEFTGEFTEAVAGTVAGTTAEEAAEETAGAAEETAAAAAEPVTGAAAEPVSEPAGEPVAEVTVEGLSEHPAASYLLHVNGVDRPVTDAWIGESLLYVLRERLGLAGAKDGCSQGECGACNVQVDGRLVASCLVPAATAAGSEVRTVEGLAVDGEPSDVQRALARCGAVQCGFCIPGMAMTVHDLLEGNHAPSELETRQALCGNLCRCSGYRGVLDAVAEVVEAREASAEAAGTAAHDHDEDEARIPHQAAPGAGSVRRPHPHEGGAL
ncbi:(2Fe-2S)-binding protein [Streptomyces sp. NBC_00654]|uniref:(2Fe-2S)-binding protein n=1 Tax=Streptomyces sp. NBC_00654 TaxID=2975799 RepID=UPI002259B007|nr:(2Fe-2S)-binding protein [Streptomyces sp. NBC_00654]MCX4969676.1 (2Fe-2S)-binding protein [Streptomyces sp. NBC_00654]